MKAREKDVASIKMQVDENSDNNITYMVRWKVFVVEMLCRKTDL